MKSLFSTRHTRYTAIVMVLIWLMTLGIGIANACMTDGAQGHHVSTAQVQTMHHDDVDGQANESDKAACLKACELGQTAFVKIKEVNSPFDSRIVPVTCLPAITVAVVDLNDLSTPTLHPLTWREPPVSIRFLRLTIEISYLQPSLPSAQTLCGLTASLFPAPLMV
jgi:hypothetical protein